MGITARDFERLQRAAKDLEQYGGAVLPFKADAVQVKDAEAMVDCTMEAFGRLDLLVNNADSSAVAEAETMSPDQWQSVIDTKLSGLFRCAQGAARPMLRSGSGQITNLASAASGYMNGKALILDRSFLSC